MQLAAARDLLAADVREGRAALIEADGGGLPFPAGGFDGVFLCWVLEHAPEPLALLREAHRLLAPGGRLYCTEVYNTSLYVRPRQAALETFWPLFNGYQVELRGDPDIGVRVPGMLHEVGFASVESRPLPWMLDKRTTDPAARAAFFDYWHAVLRSGAPGLLAAGRIQPALVERLDADFARLRAEPNALF